MTSRRATCADGPPPGLETVPREESLFDCSQPGCPMRPVEQMNEYQLAEFTELFYDGLIAPDAAFGRDAEGNIRAPHGWSVHGVPRLHPADN